MWARAMEVALAIWLVLSPLVFRVAEPTAYDWGHDILAGAFIAAFALASFAERFRYAYLLNLAVGAWLILAGYIAGWMAETPSPLHLNRLSIGVILMMFAIVPRQASQPPRSWRQAEVRSIGKEASRTPSDSGAS